MIPVPLRCPCVPVSGAGHVDQHAVEGIVGAGGGAGACGAGAGDSAGAGAVTAGVGAAGAAKLPNKSP
jgi:hypothetical protein